jgi:LuxR family maltose regulon positive regulatory protein
MIALCQLAGSYAVQGKLAKALDIYEHALELAHDPNGEPFQLIGLPYLGIGDIQRERNQLETAEKYLKDGIRLLSDWMPTSTLDGYIALALIQHGNGDVRTAWETMTRAKKLAGITEANQWDDLIVSAYAARLSIREGDLTAAMHWLLSHGSLLPNGRLDHRDDPYMVTELLDITLIRLRIAEAVRDRQNVPQLSIPLQMLNEMIEEAGRHDRGATLLELNILQSEIYRMTGEPEMAVESIIRALRLAQDEGYVRVFTDEGKNLLPLLRESLERQSRSDENGLSISFLHRLIRLISGEPTGEIEPERSIPDVEREQVEITRREEEILTLIADGCSNQEIANRLYLSLNTVKRHVYHIFNKLDAQSRMQAVNIARHKGILSHS